MPNSATPNELILESSPYLLQHAYNPVHWQPWKESVWQKAKAENKLVIVSIGYSACHWCHVMEHESFENEEVAALMNRDFISIKVDREERPDIDHIYMDAVQLITGHGGWPLNAICLPDGKPVYAGTYFKREQWMYLLAFLQDEYTNKNAETIKRAEAIVSDLKQIDIIPMAPSSDFAPAILSSIEVKLLADWDFKHGGRRGAPKFPMPSALLLLIDLYATNASEKVLLALTSTLDNMLLGGLYDHVGGGFARYSVDEYWHIPHFEKMLYDNAQLMEVYAKANRITQQEHYKQAVYGVFSFLKRELRHASGIYFSALDADSEGVEGKYYVWSNQELKTLLKDQYSAFAARFDVSDAGNFEGDNHLIRKTLNGFGSPEEKDWLTILLQERENRIAPGLDDKSITSWNCLLIKALTACFSVTEDADFLIEAQDMATFIEKHLLKEEQLFRNFKNGKVQTPAFLEDYSLWLWALLDLYDATFDVSYLTQAESICNYCIQHFYNAQNGMFFFTSLQDDPLISRKTETADNVIPSSNAVMAKVLFKLGAILAKSNYSKMAQQMTLNMQKLVEQHPFFYSVWAGQTITFCNPDIQIAIVGEHCLSLALALKKRISGTPLFLGANQSSNIPLLKDKFKEGETLIYICKNQSCSIPVKTVDEALALLN